MFLKLIVRYIVDSWQGLSRDQFFFASDLNGDDAVVDARCDVATHIASLSPPRRVVEKRLGDEVIATLGDRQRRQRDGQWC